MVSCCVPNCKSTNYRKNRPKVSFHEFPDNIVLCMKWMNAIGLTGIDPYRRLKVCSRHFRPEDFVENLIKSRLKKDVVPSVFETLHIQTNESAAPKRKIKVECLKNIYLRNKNHRKPNVKEKEIVQENSTHHLVGGRSSVADSDENMSERSKLSRRRSSVKRKANVPLTPFVWSIAGKKDAEQSNNYKPGIETRSQAVRNSISSLETAAKATVTLSYASTVTLNNFFKKEHNKSDATKWSPPASKLSKQVPNVKLISEKTDAALTFDDLCMILMEIMRDADLNNPDALSVLNQIKSYRKAKICA